MKALVIPSNRNRCFDEFLTAWTAAGDWDCVVLVEDNERRTFTAVDHRWPDRWPIHHFSHAEIRERLGKDAWIISRRDSACRCFGFLAAVELGAEWILTLDDDCRPIPGAAPICASHLERMRLPQCCETAGMRTRGLPYRQLGEIQSRLNMGLWTNVPDVDGPAGLIPQPHFTPPPGSTLAHPRRRYPVCGMNLFFAAELLPALYFPLMGEGQLYRRFDDIWAGWIFQRVAEHLGIPWTFGEPWIEHIRASDPFAKLIKEAPGIAANETIWQQIDAIELAASDLPGAVDELGRQLQSHPDQYLSRLGAALGVWCRRASR